MSLLEPGGAPLARAPLVTPDWASTYSLLGRIGQLQHPLDPDGPPVDMNMSLFPRPPGSDERPPPQPMQFNITHPQLGMFPSADAQPPSPPRSVLFNNAPPKSNTLPPDQDSGSDDDRSAIGMAVPSLPISKSGAPFFPPPPRQPAITLPSWLDVANLVAPNLVDYFTKPVPPQAPFPATPGKIPSADFNPYAGPALVDATNLATALLPGAGFADSIANRVAMMGAKAFESRAIAGTIAAARAQELAALTERASQVHNILGPISRKLRTTVAVSTDGGTIIASGARDLTPAQRSSVRPGEIAAKLPRAHAEITALAEAANAGLTPKALAATRRICSDCRTAIEGAGGVLTSKTTALFPR